METGAGLRHSLPWDEKGWDIVVRPNGQGEGEFYPQIIVSGCSWKEASFEINHGEVAARGVSKLIGL